jgi:hypothetical protein
MAKIWSQYEDSISAYYLSALINGDYTGLPEYERKAFDAWREGWEAAAREDGWTVGHWTSNGEDGFEFYGTCSVSKLRSNIVDVSLMVYKD